MNENSKSPLRFWMALLLAAVSVGITMSVMGCSTEAQGPPPGFDAKKAIEEDRQKMMNNPNMPEAAKKAAAAGMASIPAAAAGSGKQSGDAIGKATKDKPAK